MEPLSRTERAALCNTALETGESEPTLCEGWSVKDLVIHLLVRERDPWAAPGIVIPRLSGLIDLASRRLERHDFSALVERVRSGPPVWSPFWLPALEKRVNGLEYFVHHEDIRRAQPDWAPRELTDLEERQLWGALGFASKSLLKSAGVPVELRWPGAGREGADRTHRPVAGADPAVVSGRPSELTMFVFSRDQHRDLTYDGPPAAVTKVRDGRRGP